MITKALKKHDIDCMDACCRDIDSPLQLYTR